MTKDEIKAFIISQYEDMFSLHDLTYYTTPNDFDLLTEGFIDSLGILNLISSIESQYGIEIDYEDLDPEDLTKIGPLSEYIAEKANNIVL